MIFLMKQKTHPLCPTYDGIIQLCKVSMYTFRTHYNVRPIELSLFLTLL